MTSTRRWNIEYAYLHTIGIYSQANALTTPRNERFAFLLLACADLSRCYRKNLPHLYPIAVAQIWGWFAGLGEELFRGAGGEILADAMSAKYPLHCGYCGKKPCVCKEEARAEHKTLDFSSFAAGWTLNQWQQHLSNVYGEVNAVGGVPRAINRLFEEVGEVGLVLHAADGFNDPLAEMQRKIAREMTDVLAWLFTTSSLLGVDVEHAVRHVYERGCPVCHGIPCSCRAFERQPRAGTLTHRFMCAAEIERALAS